MISFLCSIGFTLLCAHTGASLSLNVLQAQSSSTPARIALVLHSDMPINALEGTLALPPSVTVGDISAHGSLLSYWVRPPQFDAASRTIYFAGVVPGGWSGTSEVLDFSVAPAAGTITIASARAFLDSPDATEVPINLRGLTLAPSVTAWYARTWPYILVGVLVALGIWALWHIRLHFS